MEYSKKYEVTDDILASSSQRIINYITDVVFIYTIIFMLFFIIAIITTIMGSNAVLEWSQEVSDLEGYLLFFLVMIPYYTFFESYNSRTIGKYFTKTMVVMEDGTKLDRSVALKRTLCRMIPFEVLSFLGGRGWHDSISNTYVVKKREFEIAFSQHNSLEEIGKNIE